MAKAEEVNSRCKCDVDIIEGIAVINGAEVRYYRCPECKFFTYNSSDLGKAVYRREPIEASARR